MVLALLLPGGCDWRARRDRREGARSLRARIRRALVLGLIAEAVVVGIGFDVRLTSKSVSGTVKGDRAGSPSTSGGSHWAACAVESGVNAASKRPLPPSTPTRSPVRIGSRTSKVEIWFTGGQEPWGPSRRPVMAEISTLG